MEMTIFIVIPMLLMTLVSAFADDWKSGEVLDVSSIRSIVIRGDASSIKISANRTSPIGRRRRGGAMAGSPAGIRAGSSTAARIESRMQIDGTTLTIAVASSRWFDLSDCTPEVLANIPPGGSVRVDQQAVMARFEGDFASLGLASKAADVTLQGHASAVDRWDGGARASGLRHAQPPTRRSMSRASVDSYLGSARTCRRLYRHAKASLIDSARPSVAGAKPLVTIKAEYARTTIR
jgi:hypothetical protein